jgi:ribonuclease HI
MPQRMKLISLRGVCLGRATNNIAEYSAVIELLVDAISLGIRRLVVRLDSQLVVLQLSNVYSIRSPTLLRVYLRIRLLERHFDYIEYQHISRNLNTLTDALANYVLDRHLNNL